MSVSTEHSLISDLRTSKKVQMEAEEYLKKKNVQFGEPKMAKRVGQLPQGNVKLTTNVYPAKLPPKIEVYRYDVTIVGIKTNDREVQFTKKFKDDFTQIERRFRSRDVIITFMQLHQDLATSAGCMYHDLQSIMYTLNPLVSPIKPKTPLSYEFTPEQLHNASSFADYKLKSVKLVFSATENCRYDLSGVKEHSDLLYVNRDLAQFLDIATSQDIFFREGEHVHFSTKSTYLYEPRDFQFTEEDICAFSDNLSYLGIGCQKGIHVIQGTGEPGIADGIPAVIVQPKKTPFHDNSMLIDKVKAMLKPYPNYSPDQIVQFLDKYLKGLMVETTHNKRNKQIFPIKGFHVESANQKKFSIEGHGLVTVADYFQQKYQQVLNRPDLPLVITDSRGPDGKVQKNFYPIEVLIVCDNQRVTCSQQMPSMTAQAIRKCAVPPAILKAQVEKLARSMHFWDSKYLEEAQIQIAQRPMELSARSLQHPEVQPATQQPHRDAATWKVGRILRPQQLIGQGQYSWAVFVFWTGPERGNIRQNEFDKFLQSYQQQANSRGIGLGQPVRTEILSLRNAKEMATHFKWAASQNLAFMLCIHGDSDDAAHHEIKANERRYFIITQCVKIGTVRNVAVKGQPLTVENILNKTNVKLGGLNFTLPRSSIATGLTTLIIGFSSNHPAGGFGQRDDESVENPNHPPSFVSGPPTAVGYAANVGPTKMPFDFIGDFVYQEARRQENVNVIETVVQRCLHYFTATRDGNMPNNVIIYRNDCSEGQYAYLLKYEIPVLKAAFQAAGCDAHLTFIVCNKLQNIRFFNQQIMGGKPADQNLKPGVAINTTVVHPVYAEFFLNSHRAIQGTARTPKYTIVYDEHGFEQQQLETITYHLCFGHQIVFSTLSLPAPVYIAGMYAKRGRNLYNACIDELKAENPQIRMEELNQKISFYDTSGQECWLAEYRVNA